MREIVYQRKLRNREASVKAARDCIPGQPLCMSSLRSLHRGMMIYRLKAVKLMRLELWSRAHEFCQFGQFT
jgi:hypothetical protein